MTKYMGLIHVAVEAKDWEEAEKVLDAIVNAKLPDEIDDKIDYMSYDDSDFCKEEGDNKKEE